MGSRKRMLTNHPLGAVDVFSFPLPSSACVVPTVNIGMHTCVWFSHKESGNGVHHNFSSTNAYRLSSALAKQRNGQSHERTLGPVTQVLLPDGLTSLTARSAPVAWTASSFSFVSCCSRAAVAAADSRVATMSRVRDRLHVVGSNESITASIRTGS